MRAPAGRRERPKHGAWTPAPPGSRANLWSLHAPSYRRRLVAAVVRVRAGGSRHRHCQAAGPRHRRSGRHDRVSVAGRGLAWRRHRERLGFGQRAGRARRGARRRRRVCRRDRHVGLEQDHRHHCVRRRASRHRGARNRYERAHERAHHVGEFRQRFPGASATASASASATSHLHLHLPGRHDRAHRRDLVAHSGATVAGTFGSRARPPTTRRSPRSRSASTAAHTEARKERAPGRTRSTRRATPTAATRSRAGHGQRRATLPSASTTVVVSNTRPAAGVVEQMVTPEGATIQIDSDHRLDRAAGL